MKAQLTLFVIFLVIIGCSRVEKTHKIPKKEEIPVDIIKNDSLEYDQVVVRKTQNVENTGGVIDVKLQLMQLAQEQIALKMNSTIQGASIHKKENIGNDVTTDIFLVKTKITIPEQNIRMKEVKYRETDPYLFKGNLLRRAEAIYECTNYTELLQNAVDKLDEPAILYPLKEMNVALQEIATNFELGQVEILKAIKDNTLKIDNLRKSHQDNMIKIDNNFKLTFNSLNIVKDNVQELFLISRYYFGNIFVKIAEDSNKEYIMDFSVTFKQNNTIMREVILARKEDIDLNDYLLDGELSNNSLIIHSAPTKYPELNFAKIKQQKKIYLLNP